MVFLNPHLLFGLFAVAIPPAVHLLARRRYDEVDWGAMQFLRLGPKSRRKLLLEQWLLLAARMAVLGLLVVALAAPVVRTSLLAGDRRPRTTVILIDNSASMAARHDGQTGGDAARAWVSRFVSEVRRGDRVAVFAVAGEVVPLIAATQEPAQARSALELLPSPRGTADWPAAVEAAVQKLESAPGEPEILVVSDGQRFGWADAETLARWDLLARRFAAEGRTLPPVWVVNVVPGRPPTLPNAGLLPITTNRAVAAAGTEVRFRSAVRHVGVAAPSRVRLEIDGRPAGELPVPATPAAELPITFTRRFPPGSHLITLRLDPDAVPGDDRQDFALDVIPVIPVLIVDGATRSDTRGLGSDFLRDALAPARDPSPAFAVRVVRADEFVPTTLAQNVTGPGTAPRVLVLANLAKVTAEQAAAVERFLAGGGGVLVAPGDRCDPAEWNRVDWLPGRLAEVIGADANPARPDTRAFQHPAVEAFREDLPGGLQTARFPRYWRIESGPGGSIVLGPLTTGDPFLVERPHGRGRVAMTAVPLDHGWGTNLIGLPDFVRLAHELTYHLAQTRAAEANLTPGRPFAFRPRGDEPPAPVTVRTPDGNSVVVPVRAWPAVFDRTRDPGAYRLTTADGAVADFVVRPDPRESDLTPTTAADQQRVAERLSGVEAVDSLDELRDRRGRGAVSRDVTGLVLFGVLVLLATEAWYTRWLARFPSGRGWLSRS
jgi:hypothetical protein